MSLFDSASLVVTPNGTKASKLYAIKPTDASGDLSVTRATTATRVNSSGLIESVATNVPRLDYTNSTCPSILVEPQRTNLLSYSEQFDNVSWIKSNSSITANSVTAPDGTLTADKLVENSSNANHLVQKAVVASNAVYTFSVFAKKSERNWVVLRGVNASFQNVKAWFNIDAGTIGTLENGATAKITNVGNGWYKLEMTIPSFSTGFEFRVSTSTGNNVDSYTGDGTSGLFIWGAQLEAGSYATSYIPTVASSVTRNADVISKTGISSLIGQTEGTIFIDFIINAKSGNTNILNSERNTTASFSVGVLNDGRVDADLFSSGSPVARITQGSLVVGQRYKVAYSYKSGGTYLYINGALAGTSTDSFTLPSTLDDIFLNDVNSYFNDMQNVSFKTAALWKTRLTNTELATLTTI